MKKHLTEQQRQDHVRAFTKSPLTQIEYCDETGIGLRSLQGWCKRYKNPQIDPAKLDNNTPEAHYIKKSTIHTDGNGNVKQMWLKTDLEKEAQISGIKAAMSSWVLELPKFAPTAPKSNVYHDHIIPVLPMGDPHIGLLTWEDEVGKPFDLEIARNDLCNATRHLVNLTTPAKTCKIINLGDFFHFDNMDAKTSRSGHSVDAASRLPHCMRVGTEAMLTCIRTALERHETVEIINTVGNHDDVTSWALNLICIHAFEHEPRVIVHHEYRHRYYTRHGDVLIGVVHGHETKAEKLPLLMATERPVDWGETKHRYFFQGHYHHDKRIEMNGCMFEQFRTLAPNDSYSHGHGYFSGQDMKAILMHSKYGEVGRHICSVDMLRDMY